MSSKYEVNHEFKENEFAGNLIQAVGMKVRVEHVKTEATHESFKSEVQSETLSTEVTLETLNTEVESETVNTEVESSEFLKNEVEFERANLLELRYLEV